MRGIIPRSIEKIIAECAKFSAQGWRYTIEATYLEIYNETIRDLLADKIDPHKKHNIKMDPKGGLTVTDLTTVQIYSPNQVDTLMEKASRVRSVGSTDMNAESSRSHSVFTLSIKGVSVCVQDESHMNVTMSRRERVSRNNITRKVKFGRFSRK